MNLHLSMYIHPSIHAPPPWIQHVSWILKHAPRPKSVYPAPGMEESKKKEERKKKVTKGEVKITGHAGPSPMRGKGTNAMPGRKRQVMQILSRSLSLMLYPAMQAKTRTKLCRSVLSSSSGDDVVIADSAKRCLLSMV